MPSCPRKEIFVPEEIGIYHCFSRCVRRSYLCGRDEVTKKDYSHRKEWFETRIQQMQQVFLIDMLGYSFLDNHFHNTIRNRPDLVSKLSDREVARRSLMLSPGRMPEGVELEEPDQEQIERVMKDPEHIKKWRNRLSCISCYMRYLKEAISRRANAEDKVSGSFWEGRFKSVRLLDPIAVTICSMYVDLNEVRAELAPTPEKSQYTSISARAKAWVADRKRKNKPAGKREWGTSHSMKREAAPPWLAPINENVNNGTRRNTMTEEQPQAHSRRPSNSGFLPMTVEQYFQLCDWSGRRTQQGKRGKITPQLAPILERLTCDTDMFQYAVENFPRLFKRYCGSPEQIRKVRQEKGQKNFHGLPAARKLYPPVA